MDGIFLFYTSLYFAFLDVARQEGLIALHELHAGHGSHVEGIKDAEDRRAGAGHGAAQRAAVLHHRANGQNLAVLCRHQGFKAVAEIARHLQEVALLEGLHHGVGLG